MTRYIIILAFLSLPASAQVVQMVQPYARLNTKGYDYAITFRSACAGTEVWFTTDRKDGRDGSRRMVWGGSDATATPAELPWPLNQKADRGSSALYLDGAPSFDPCDPEFGVFTSNRLVDGKDFDNDLYEMRHSGGAWQVRRIDENGVNSDSWDDTPSLFMGETTRYLYFASDRRRAGRDESDIYMSRRLADGQWSAPVPLEEICESREAGSGRVIREQTPCVGPDGYLYYATDRSGDFEIWRARLDPLTGRPVGGGAPISFPGVNLAGSMEGHPAFSPGGNWFIFTSNRTSRTDFDLFHLQLADRADTVTIRTVLRTREKLANTLDADDITRPMAGVPLTLTELPGGAPATMRSNEAGQAVAILPRRPGREPAEDRRIRSVELRATTSGADLVASTDTLMFELGYDCALDYTLFIWDTTVLYQPRCEQEFRVRDVEFFIKGYWCPSSRRYSQLTPCQTVFVDPQCAVIPDDQQPAARCDDNELYDYELVPARIERVRRPDLCISWEEISGRVEQWSRNVDRAIDELVTSMESALKAECIQRATQEGKPVTVEVTGWTDPDPIHPHCRYTGPTIDFNRDPVRLLGLSEKSWLRGGVLATGTRFVESPSEGNQLLSDLRAYYVATLLDSLWKLRNRTYATLRERGLLTIVARGNAVSQRQIAAERQRSVEVKISAEVDSRSVADMRRRSPGIAVALCGNDCILNLSCRDLLRTSRPAR